VSSSQELNIVILGAQSSVGKSVTRKLITFDYKVIGTYRSPLQLDAPAERIDWQYLNLDNLESISSFITFAENQPVDVILNLIGSLSGLDNSADVKELQLYFGTYISNQTILLKELLTKCNPRLFINLSSRAVIYGSNDFYYSEAKSAIHGLTKSLAKIHKDIDFINLIPGLIKDSAMFLSMPEQVQRDHLRRAGGKLLELDEVAECLVNLVAKSALSKPTNDGTCLDLVVGPQYA